jgi:hypothetical protein
MLVAIAVPARACAARLSEPELVNDHSGTLSRKWNECFRFDIFSPGRFRVLGEGQHRDKDLRSGHPHRRRHLATCTTHLAIDVSTQGGRHEPPLFPSCDFEHSNQRFDADTMFLPQLSGCRQTTPTMIMGRHLPCVLSFQVYCDGSSLT